MAQPHLRNERKVTAEMLSRRERRADALQRRFAIQKPAARGRATRSADPAGRACERQRKRVADGLLVGSKRDRAGDRSDGWRGENGGPDAVLQRFYTADRFGE